MNSSGETYNEAKANQRKLLNEAERGVDHAKATGWTVGSWCEHWLETMVKVELAEGDLTVVSR